MFTPITRAVAQLDDPAFLRIIAASLAVSGLVFAVLCGASFYGLHHLLAPHSWLAWAAGILGGLAVAASALWLFLPMAILIASLFQEPVCRAVERRWYPGLPEAEGAALPAQLWDGLSVALLVAFYSLVSLVLALLIPGIGLFLGWGITAWAVGRGLFVAVAMRRMSRAEALALYRFNRVAVLAQGAALAVASTVPLLNLLVPVLGTAAMVHVLLLGVSAGNSPKFVHRT